MGELHGYGIVLHIHRASDELLSVEEGSLDPALRRTEQRGWIVSAWDLTETCRTAKFYKLTSVTIPSVRSVVSILMNLVLALTFLQAPFLHVHEHESTANHPHRFFHTHFPHHPISASKSPEFRGLDPDDDAQFQQWFSATISDLSTPLFIPTSIYIVASAGSSEPFFETNILSGTDPPRRSRSAPRSPPA